MARRKTPTIGKFLLTAQQDVPDFRDWEYKAPLIQLKRSIARPGNARILNQQNEGACTGFGLAAVINLLGQRRGSRVRVSARMLYEMAKRHDEWSGYRYEGSSCRGAIKGWYNMGVCRESYWKYEASKPGELTIKAAKDARRNTVGAYYRLGNRVSDYHAALNEAGAIYCSASVHTGWENRNINKRTGRIPFRDKNDGGHAFAIVGYNADGFWVQNSWGRGWGRGGFALWTYEDWQKNIMDAWVVRLGLPTPQIWHLPSTGGSDAAKSRVASRGTPERGEIAGHFVHIDDGDLVERGRYWSNIGDVRMTAELVAQSDKYDHLLLYAHGGLNSPEDSATRIAAMKETFKANRIYPYHFMYDTGLMEELGDVIFRNGEEVGERVGGPVADVKDFLIEQAVHLPGRALWREMKSGAKKPFDPGRAGVDMLSAFLSALAAPGARPKTINVIGHSTGAILHAYLLGALATLNPGMRVRTCSLLAPAATIALYQSNYQPLLAPTGNAFGIANMAVYNMTDALEQDDDVVVVYGKSLLYMVSNALEEEREAPILGMQIFSRDIERGRGAKPDIYYSDGGETSSSTTASTSHGGFDNDPVTMNHVLRRVLGSRPQVPFTRESLTY